MTSYQFKCGIFDEECEKVSFAQALFFWSDNDVVKLIHKIEKFHPQVKKPLVAFKAERKFYICCVEPVAHTSARRAVDRKVIGSDPRRFSFYTF